MEGFTFIIVELKTLQIHADRAVALPEVIMELQILYVHITRTFQHLEGKSMQLEDFRGFGDGATKVQFQSIIYYSVVGLFLGSYTDHLCSLNS